MERSVFRFMGKHLYAQESAMSSGFTEKRDGNPFNGSDSVSASMRRRQPLRDILNRKMKEAGVSPPDIVRLAQEKGLTIGKTTINDVLTGTSQNPGIYTVEALAVGMNLSPEQFTAEILGGRTDDPNFKGSQFAMLNEIYKSMTPSQRQKADAHIEGILFQLQRIKNQR